MPPIPSGGGNKLSYNLINTTVNNSYVFHCDSSVSNHPIRKAIVRKSIELWNCKTGVNWLLGNDTILKDQKDGINVICFTNDYKGDPLASTARYFNTSTTTNGQGVKAYTSEIDIKFSTTLDDLKNPNMKWFYDTIATENVPYPEFDFFGALLHEFGHAHSLGHINNISEVMYYTESAGYKPYIYRNVNLGQWSNTRNAGLYVISESELIQYTSPINPIVKVIPTNCGNLASVNQTIDLEKLAVYPNPTNDIVFLVTEQQYITEVLFCADRKKS